MVITYILKTVVQQVLFAGGDLCNICGKVKELKNNLRKAPKLSYPALHPKNNLQNVPLALAVINETRITAARSYCQNQRYFANF